MENSFRYILLVTFSLCGVCIHSSFVNSSWTTETHAEWKKLILTHHWPVTVCKMVGKKCEAIPSYWTLHGLWTDKAQFCNQSWHFDVSEIKDILADMNKWWPDFLHPNCSQLWKHEWQKHGTCAATLPCLDTQLKYFSKGLELYKSVDLNSALEKYEIKPANTYKVEEIENAIVNTYGVIPKIQCLPPEQGEDTQTLGQIEICFTNDFNLKNCTVQLEDQFLMRTSNEELHVCDKSIKTYYPPVQ